MQTALVWGLCQIMAKQANVVVLTFVEERETKNTIRFQEQVKGELDVPQIGTLYISKAMLKDLQWKRGAELKISIELK